MKTIMNMQAWLPLALAAFLAGMVTFGLASGELTGGREEALAEAHRAGFDAGYTQALAENPSLAEQTESLGLISITTFVDSLELELKSITQHRNAVDFIYGEHEGERHRVSALNAGEAIAHQFGNRLYVIRNDGVAANLQHATFTVRKFTLP